MSKSRLKPFYRIWSDFIRRNFLGTSNNGNLTLESAKILHVMVSLSDVPFGYLLFRSILSKTKHSGKQQMGFPIQPCLITLLSQRAGVPPDFDDLCARSMKDLEKRLMTLSDVICAAAHGDLRLLPSLSVSQARQIVYLSKINSLHRQFVEFQSSMCQTMSSPHINDSSIAKSLSQSSLNPSSFVPEPYVHPPKLVSHCHVAPSSSSYFTVNSFSHSGAMTTKMVAIYAAKGK